jgi:hypothetical protein
VRDQRLADGVELRSSLVVGGVGVVEKVVRNEVRAESRGVERPCTILRTPGSIDRIDRTPVNPAIRRILSILSTIL